MTNEANLKACETREMAQRLYDGGFCPYKGDDAVRPLTVCVDCVAAWLQKEEEKK